MTKLTDIQVREIRRLFKTKMSKQKDMAEKYGVSVATINNIIARRAYKHIVDEEIIVDLEKQYRCRVQEDCSKCFKNSSLRSAHAVYGRGGGMRGGGMTKPLPTPPPPVPAPAGMPPAGGAAVPAPMGAL